ncbi:THO complex subunit 2, partial [Quaeritorhiza haematococci]
MTLNSQQTPHNPFLPDLQLLRNWDSAGRLKLLTTAKTTLLSLPATAPAQAHHQLITHLQSLCLHLLQAGLRGDLGPHALASFLFDFYKEATAELSKSSSSASSSSSSSSNSITATPTAADDSGSGTINIDGSIIYIGPERVDDPGLIPSIVVDALWMLDLETDSQMGSGAANAAASATANAARARLVNITKEIVAKDFIPPHLMRERLEVEFLETAGLIPSHKAFSKKVIRTNTALLYKQTKFNLLREESEGYSKLITELYSNLPPVVDSHAIKQAVSRGEDAMEVRKRRVKERVQLVLRNVKGLIGYFDLDPNRVLDIILDVFVGNLLDHWDFFVELLEASQWRSRVVKRTVLRKRVVRNNTPTPSSSSTSTSRIGTPT